MQYHAFLSYSRRDKNIMRRIHKQLSEMGLHIWTDESLVPGTASWKNAIEEAIQNSMTLVVILSPDAKQSDWIEKEIDYARACNVTVIPVLARGAHDISAIPFELINVQRIDLRADFSLGVQQLAETIRAEGTLEEAIPANPILHGGEVIEELNHISFYDHVRLFVWIFWQPEKLVVYRERYDDESLRRTAAWLISDLTWVGFLAPTIGFVLGTVDVPDSDPTTATALQAVTGVVFFAGWFVTGWLGWREQPVYAAALILIITVGIVSVFSANFLFSDFVLSQAGGMTRPAFLTLTGIMLATAAGIGFRITPPAVGSVAGIILGSLIFNALFSIQLQLDGGIMAFVMFVTTILVAWVVDNSLKTGTRTPFHTLALGWIGLGGAGLIVVCFLGGWLWLLGIEGGMMR